VTFNLWLFLLVYPNRTPKEKKERNEAQQSVCPGPVLIFEGSVIEKLLGKISSLLACRANTADPIQKNVLVLTFWSL